MSQRISPNISISMTGPMVFVQILLLLFAGSSTVYAGIMDAAVADTLMIVSQNAGIDKVIAKEARLPRLDQDERKLSQYALYNLETFSVRFMTEPTSELERVRSSVKQEKGGGIGDSWTLVSETGGFESSLSYPIRSVTEDFLYIGFQNLIDGWILELNGGPDGNNDMSYRNSSMYDGDFSNRLRSRLLQQSLARDRQENTESIGDVFNIDAGASTGEQDYNTDSWVKYNNNIPGSQIKAESVQGITESGEMSDSITKTKDQQQIGTPQMDPSSMKENASTNQEKKQTISREIESMLVPSPADNQSLAKEEKQRESQQTQSTPLPNDNQYSSQEEQPLESSKIESSSISTSREDQSPNIEAQYTESSPFEPETGSEPPVVANSQIPSNYVDIYNGLVYHSFYDHLVTVDLRVKLYLRKGGFSGDEDSLRKNLRRLQIDNNGDVELIAEMTPTIAFLEPVSEKKKLEKPSNAEVRELFGGWMEFMFGKQRDVYLRTLRDYPDQALLQGISKLRVDNGAIVTPSILSSNSSSNTDPGGWSETTQHALIATMAVLGIVAVIWPMYAWAQHVKKNRELSLQLMHGGLSLEGGDDFSDSFGSITYRDNIHDMVKLPPINHSIPLQNSSLPRPQIVSMIQRVSSMDAVRHGKDIFPSKERSDSQKSAMTALEASDRYLSKHRPDLFYDQQTSEKKGTVNVFGRVYEIPSNPFEFIYKGENVQSPSNLSPSNPSMDLGRAAHFPFASPGSSFTTPRPSSLGSKPFTGRATSVGSIGNNSTGSATHFTPIVVPNQNLAAGFGNDSEEPKITAVPGIAAHTGRTWQNNETNSSASSHMYQSRSTEGTTGSVIGDIFRNLSISSWYNGANISNSYTANGHVDPDFNPSASVGTEEVYYDDYHEQHKDPLFQSDIELESLPNDEEDPANYDFAFQDFPRKDGTPCLIIDDDSFLSERKRRESAKMIFAVGDEAKGNKDDGSLPEKKLCDVPVSDEAFKMMLSQNAVDIDNSVLQVDSSDNSMVLPPLEGSFLSKDPHDVKSPEFQQKLTRLMDTKRQLYVRENKNAAIVAANRKKRKNVRERERVDRHKAIERELEDIEAEFSLTMQPLSPDRNKNLNNSSSSIHGHLTPKRNSHSPKPPTAGPRYSPMPSRIIASPARKNIATLSPPRSNASNIAANSPIRSNTTRRHNSIGGSHRKQNSLGASPFRPRTRYPNHAQSHSMGGNSGIFRQGGLSSRDSVSRSASHRSISPPNLGGPTPEYKPKFRPTHKHASSHGVDGGSNYDDLSLPSMTIGGENDHQLYDAKFRSPQAVIDEVLRSGAQNSMHKPRHYPQSQPMRHQRSLTPSRMRPVPSSSAQKFHAPRRTHSLDMNDDSFHRRIHPPGSTISTSSSSQLPHHPIIRQSPATKSNGNHSHHRRVNSGGMGSNHKRSSSRDEDIFLHGVVAQTRFI